MAKVRTIHGLTQDERDRIASMFAGHKASERQSISWHMNRTKREWRWSPGKAVVKDDCYCANLAYSVTWTPGTLCLAGDLGEFTVTHYNAMRTIELTLDWLDGIGFSYLMGKSDAQEVYDEEATFTEIVRLANDTAKDSLIALRNERREYRSECAAARVEWADAVAAWESDPSEGPQPALADFMPDDADLILTSLNLVHRVPEGWELWYRIHREVGFGGPEQIFTKQGRDELKDSLRERLGDENGAASLCMDLRIDDFYGYRHYPVQCHVWHAAIQAWVAIVKPKYLPEAARAA